MISLEKTIGPGRPSRAEVRTDYSPASVPGKGREYGVRPVLGKRRTDWTLGNTGTILDGKTRKCWTLARWCLGWWDGHLRCLPGGFHNVLRVFEHAQGASNLSFRTIELGMIKGSNWRAVQSRITPAAFHNSQHRKGLRRRWRSHNTGKSNILLISCWGITKKFLQLDLRSSSGSAEERGCAMRASRLEGDASRGVMTVSQQWRMCKVWWSLASIIVSTKLSK